MQGDFYAQGAWRSLLDEWRRAGLSAQGQRDRGSLSRRFLAGAGSIAPTLPASCRRPPGFNIALGRPATQSSVSQWSAGKTAEEDAGHAVNGVLSGRDTFHTDVEDNPWWRVDLGARAEIAEIRVFNRMEHPAIESRLNPFALELSDDASLWRTLYTKSDDELVGGVDGKP